MEKKTIKAYKGFNKDLKCRDFQYEIGKEYEIDGDIKVCKRGFHACENPMDVFDYYDMLNSRFAEVEQSGKIDIEYNSTKVCSSKIKVKAELKLADVIKLGVEWLKEVTSPGNMENKGNLNDNGAYYAQIGSSGNSAQIGSSGDYAKIGSSGNSAQIDSSGDSAKIGSSGNSAQIGSSGNCAQIGSSGNSAQIGSSGNYAQIGSSGNCAKIDSSGYCAKINSTGEHSVIMAAGYNSIAKAKKGSWITLAEWGKDNKDRKWKPVCVKTEQVDGDIIKADTWYRLVNGKFEVATE